MALKDLQIKQGSVNIEVIIAEKGEPREFEKFGKPGRVSTAIVKDDSGTMKFTLWNDDITKVNVGDKVQIKNGFVSEWQGEPQLTTGRFGTLEVITPAAQIEKEVTEDEKTETEVLEGKGSDESSQAITPDEKEEAELFEKKQKPDSVLDDDDLDEAPEEEIIENGLDEDEEDPDK